MTGGRCDRPRPGLEPARRDPARSAADSRSRAPRRRSDLRGDAGAGWSGTTRVADPGAHRGARPADAACPDNGPPHPSLGALLDRDGPESLGAPPRPARRRGARSTRGSCSRIGSARTRRPGPRPRTGSRPTSCSPTASSTRGCATLTASARGRADPDPARRPHARRAGRPARDRRARRDATRADRWS